MSANAKKQAKVSTEKNPARSAAGRKGYLARLQKQHLRTVCFWALVAPHAELLRDATLWNLLNEGFRKGAANGDNIEGEQDVIIVTEGFLPPTPPPLVVTREDILGPLGLCFRPTLPPPLPPKHLRPTMVTPDMLNDEPAGWAPPRRYLGHLSRAGARA